LLGLYLRDYFSRRDCKKYKSFEVLEKNCNSKYPLFRNPVNGKIQLVLEDDQIKGEEQIVVGLIN
jgi:hypothetical protein